MIKKYENTLIIDLDNTLIQFNFPHIGKPIEYAIEAMHILVSRGWKCYIYSCRNNPMLYKYLELRDMNIFSVALALKSYGFPKIDIDSGRVGKLIGKWYIDDQGIKFQSWDKLINIIEKRNNNNIFKNNNFYNIKTVNIGIENCILSRDNKIIDGSKDALSYMIKKGYRIILSTIKSNLIYYDSFHLRNKELKNIINLLKGEKIQYSYFDDGYVGKLPADFYIEENMIPFNGSWHEVLDFLL